MKYVGILVALMSVTGCLGNRSLAEGSAISSPVTQQALLNRWNATVEDQPSTEYDFHWPTFREFPHPTFKGGTVEGYRIFAVVLLSFLESDDNFDFLANQHLLDASLSYALSSGQVETWTFRELVNEFAAEQSFGVDSVTRAGLAQMATRIDEAD